MSVSSSDSPKKGIFYSIKAYKQTPKDQISIGFAS